MFTDHVTLRSRDLRKTSDFMVQVFDLEVGRRPIEVSGIPGHWLYSDGEPLVHIIEPHGQGLFRAAELIYHAGFRKGDYSAIEEKLELLGIIYRAIEIPSFNEQRIFSSSGWATAGNGFPGSTSEHN